MQKVAVIQGLQTQVIKLQVTVCLEGCAQSWQVKLKQFVVQQFVVHTFLDEARKVVNIGLRHVGLHNVMSQCLFGNGVKQQACCGIGVIRIFFNQGTGCQHGRLVHLVHGNAVIQVAHGLCHDGLRGHVGTQVGAGCLDEALQAIQIENNALTVVQRMQHGCRRCFFHYFSGTFLIVLFPVQHIGASHFVMAAAHQA